MQRGYRVGTRTSALAIKQVQEVLETLKKFYPAIEVEIVGMDTYGDRDKDTPISKVEGSDFFTRELDQALLQGDIDFALHSAKDLPETLAPGLFIAAITKSIDSFDVLVAKDNLKLNGLKIGAKIGTSSTRRKLQLKRYRGDLQVVDLRGNIEERLQKLEHSDLDAIVIAAAGLVRLGLEKRIAQRIPFEIIKPHPLQGALAVVTRAQDANLIKLISVIDARAAILA